MLTTKRSNGTDGTRQLRRRLLMSLLAGLVAVTVLGSTGGAPAGAWVYGRSSGRPGGMGSISPVQLADIYSRNSLGLPVAQATFMANAGPVISRSPATTQGQDVYLVYSIERFNGYEWTGVAQPVVSGRIPAGVSQVRLAPLNFAPNSAKGYYRVSYILVWFVAGANINYATPLGSTVVLSDRASDHTCTTRLRPCQVFAGYLQYGRLYELGGGW